MRKEDGGSQPGYPEAGTSAMLSAIVEWHLDHRPGMSECQGPPWGVGMSPGGCPLPHCCTLLPASACCDSGPLAAGAPGPEHSTLPLPHFPGLSLFLQAGLTLCANPGPSPRLPASAHPLAVAAFPRRVVVCSHL